MFAPQMCQLCSPLVQHPCSIVSDPTAKFANTRARHTKRCVSHTRRSNNGCGWIAHLLSCVLLSQVRAGEDGVRTWFDLSRQTVQPRWQRRRHAVPGLPAGVHIESEVLRAGSRDGRGGVTSACMRVSGEPRACAARPASVKRAGIPLHDIAMDTQPIRRMAV